MQLDASNAGSFRDLANFPRTRIDEHAETVKAALPELRHKPSEYVLSGRYFQSIEIPEGEMIGFDLDRDRERYTVTDSGIVVIPKGSRPVAD